MAGLGRIGKFGVWQLVELVSGGLLSTGPTLSVVRYIYILSNKLGGSGGGGFNFVKSLFSTVLFSFFSRNYPNSIKNNLEKTLISSLKTFHLEKILIKNGKTNFCRRICVRYLAGYAVCGLFSPLEPDHPVRSTGIISPAAPSPLQGQYSTVQYSAAPLHLCVP